MIETCVMPVLLYGSLVNDVGIGAETMRVLMDDVESLCLAKECHELEDGLGHSIIATDDLLSAAEDVNLKRRSRRRTNWRDVLRSQDCL